jgi:hypothetical protein
MLKLRDIFPLEILTIINLFLADKDEYNKVIKVINNFPKYNLTTPRYKGQYIFKISDYNFYLIDVENLSYKAFFKEVINYYSYPRNISHWTKFS